MWGLVLSRARVPPQNPEPLSELQQCHFTDSNAISVNTIKLDLMRLIHVREGNLAVGTGLERWRWRDHDLS